MSGCEVVEGASSIASMRPGGGWEMPLRNNNPAAFPYPISADTVDAILISSAC